MYFLQLTEKQYNYKHYAAYAREMYARENILKDF